MRIEHRAHQHPVAATDVDEPLDPGQVIGADERGRDERRSRRHRIVDQDTRSGMTLEVLPEPATVRLAKSSLAGPHAVGEVSVRPPMPLLADHDRAPAYRPGHTLAQHPAKAGQSHAPVVQLLEDPDVRQQPHDRSSERGSAPTREATSPNGAGPADKQSATPSLETAPIAALT